MWNSIVLSSSYCIYLYICISIILIYRDVIDFNFFKFYKIARSKCKYFHIKNLDIKKKKKVQSHNK